MDEELERLAREGRERKQAESEAATQAAEREQAGQRSARQKAQRRMLRRSLQTPLAGLTWILALPGGFIAMLATNQLLMAPIGFAAGALLGQLLDACGPPLQMRWLRGLPFALDAEAYRTMLANDYGKRDLKLRLTVELEEPPTPDEGRLFADAMAGAIPKSEASFANGEIVIRSPPLATYTPVGRGFLAANNIDLHRWCRRAIDRGVRKLHRKRRVRRVRV